MKIKWYGHAAFRLETKDGVSIVIDPYTPGGPLRYEPVTDSADVVLTTHGHGDHNYTKEIKGTYTLIDKDGAYLPKGIPITAIPVFHDESGGKERGNNLLFKIEADGLVLLHAGDLGHTLDNATLAKIGRVDILFIPVGGFYTIGPNEAEQVMNAIHPAITLPMHYKTEKCDYPIGSVEGFITDKHRVRTIGGSELEISKEKLPKEPEIIVLKHAL